MIFEEYNEQKAMEAAKNMQKNASMKVLSKVRQKKKSNLYCDIPSLDYQQKRLQKALIFQLRKYRKS